MKRASYRHGVALIAVNDEPLDLDEESIAGYISVGLLAGLFGVDTQRVAHDVWKYRARELKDEAERNRISAEMEEAEQERMERDAETSAAIRRKLMTR